MKKILIIILSVFLFSCENEPVDFNLVKNNSIALDTLKNYSDYILGDFNGQFLVSTHVHSKGYSASINSLPIDSTYIQYHVAYKLKENNIEKSLFVNFRFLEEKNKLDTVYYKYINFSDFVGFFDRDKFDYFQLNHPINNIHNVIIQHLDYYIINNEDNSFITSKYINQMTSENFNFKIDSIKVIQNPVKKVEVYYSFKCIGVNQNQNELKMENGKGKSTFEYN